MNSSKRFLLTLLVVSCAISAGMLWRIYADKSEYREMYKGNVGTEVNPYIAGLNFTRHGFANLYFLPAIQRYDDSLDALLKEGLYVHFPPGPDLMSGVMQMLGIHGFYQQKLCLLPLNLAAVLLLMLTIRRLLPEERGEAPFILASIIVTSVWFVWWASNLHQHTYNDFFMALGLWAAVARKDRLYLLVCFVATCFSFEPVPWLGILATYFATEQVAAKVWSIRRAAVFVGAAGAMFILSFGLHLLQNGWWMHSLWAAVDDFRTAYKIRGAAAGSGANQYSLTKHLAKGAYAILWFYGTGVLILAGIGLNAAIRRRLWLPVILLCAGLAWPILFRQHSMIHAFTWLHLGIGLFLLATIGLLQLWRQTSGKKIIAALLLALAVLRLPLGCEVSTNRLLLGQLRRVVAKTDSATIAELLYFFKDSPEHILERQILLNELTTRAHVATDLPAYALIRDGDRVTLARDEQGHIIRGRNLPADRTPVFHDDTLPYFDAVGLRNAKPDKPLPVPPPAVELIVEGSPDRTRYRLLLAYLLLQ